MEVPAILLESDLAPRRRPQGPGQRYALGAEPLEAAGAGIEELPPAYGTGQLLLSARDPHWLYAHWDLTREQARHHLELAADGRLVLRVFKSALAESPVLEIPIPPEAQNWFARVEEAGTVYLAELGYYDRQRQWQRVAVSEAVMTPGQAVSEEEPARFETIPVDVPFAQLLETVKAVISENVPLVEALQQMRAAGHPELPGPAPAVPPAWTPAQERALAAVMRLDEERRLWLGSLEITQWVRQKLEEGVSSAAAAGVSVPEAGAAAPGAEGAGVQPGASPTAPFGPPAREKGFWFNVNAELVIYGATEPGAQVTVGGHPITLRPDGTFSCRFALPDGIYEVPVEATAQDGSDRRRAELAFSRVTRYTGDVGASPQDSRLRPPRPEGRD